MRTFNNSSELLASNSIGIGKTDHIPAIGTLQDNTLSYNGFSVSVSPVWVESYALMSVHTKLKDLPNHKQQELLLAFSENRLALTHKFDASPVVKTAIAGHYLSSDALLSSYFAKIDAVTVQDIFNLLLTVKAGMTKDVILDIVQSARDMIITDEQLQAVTVLEDKERALIDARTKLEEIGCTDVNFTSEISLTAIVDFAIVSKIAAGVSGLNRLRDKDKLLADDRILVSFELEGGNDE
jgi:hypothetical protein